MARINIRATLWRYKEECDSLEWKFRNGRLTREEMNRFCSAFAITHLVGFGSGGLPIIQVVTSANTTNFNLFSAAGSPGFPVDVRHTINSGIYVYSTSTGTPGYDVGAGWASGSLGRLTNQGFVMGKGGKGAAANGSPSLTGAEAGGDAMRLAANIVFSIDNTGGFIAGGGGGGGGDVATIPHYGNTVCGGGGGAGGGDGGDTAFSVQGVFAPGGSGGGPGSGGGNGTLQGIPNGWSGAGGGGRVLPGSGGSGAGCGGHFISSAATGGTAGGGGGNQIEAHGCTGPGGNGGSANAGGGSGASSAGGGGGGWGAAGGSGGTSGGAAGGKAINLNGQSLITIAAGTQYGAVS